jgi:CheY-like chemotaxis protein
MFSPMCEHEPPIEPGPTPLRRLLLVEDDALVGETIASMLEDHFQTVAVASVADALAGLAAGAAPAVILLDCLMPGGNPRGLLAEADRLGVPVVLTSGDPRESDRIDPGRRFLSKPFTQAALLKVLDAGG